MESIEVLDRLGACLVVNKPPGVPTQAPAGIDSMEARVRSLWQDERGATHRVYVGVPHRLDRPASGALLFLRNQRATQRIARQFQQREVDKSYLAIVEGGPKQGESTWEDDLVKDPGKAHVSIATPDQPHAVKAILSYRVLRCWPHQTLVHITLHTGRTHQIRVQFASRGFPILGDVQYGASQVLAANTADPRQRPIALHARRIRFRHPTEPFFVTVTAPLPTFWSPLLGGDVFEWEKP